MFAPNLVHGGSIDYEGYRTEYIHRQVCANIYKNLQLRKTKHEYTRTKLSSKWNSIISMWIL